MKTVYLIIFVFLFGIAVGDVFLLTLKITKEPAMYSGVRGRGNDNALKWLEDRKKLSACEDKVVQLKKITQFGQQGLVGGMALEKQQAELQAQVSVLTRQKSALEAQLAESTQAHAIEAIGPFDALKGGNGKEKEAKGKEAVNVPSAGNVAGNEVRGGNGKGTRDKVIARLNKNITDLNRKVSLLEKMSDDLRKNNRGLMIDNKQLKRSKGVLYADVARLKPLIAKLEKKAKEFFLRAVRKEQVEEENRQLNKVVSSLSKERVVLSDQVDDLKNKIKAMWTGEVNCYIEEGDVYIKQGLYNQAIEAYNKAAGIDPNNADVQLKLGFLYQRAQDQPKEAVYHFKRYLSLQPHAKDRKEVEYLIEMLSPQD